MLVGRGKGYGPSTSNPRGRDRFITQMADDEAWGYSRSRSARLRFEFRLPAPLSVVGTAIGELGSCAHGPREANFSFVSLVQTCDWGTGANAKNVPF